MDSNVDRLKPRSQTSSTIMAMTSSRDGKSAYEGCNSPVPNTWAIAARVSTLPHAKRPFSLSSVSSETMSRVTPFTSIAGWLALLAGPMVNASVFRRMRVSAAWTSRAAAARIASNSLGE